MAKKWQRLDGELLHRTPYYDFVHDRYVLPDGVSRGDYYYIDITGSTAVIPRLPSGELVLVRQHRYLFGRASLELPAGGIRPGDDPLATARQELAEEAGLAAARWAPLGTFAPYNGASNELCHLFLAEDLRPVAACPEPTEELEVVQLRLEEINERIRTGEVWDGMTIAGLALLSLLG